MIRIYAVINKSGKRWTPLLFSACTITHMPSVPLSRNGNSCYFGIDQLHNHNDHAPAFSTKTEALRYLKRVANNIKDMVMLNDLTVCPSNPNVIEIFSKEPAKKL